MNRPPPIPRAKKPPTARNDEETKEIGLPPLRRGISANQGKSAGTTRALSNAGRNVVNQSSKDQLPPSGGG